jgi:hypothetical protein
MAVIPQPLYSLALTSCENFPFQKMKLKLKGRWFNTIEKIQANRRERERERERD